MRADEQTLAVMLRAQALTEIGCSYSHRDTINNNSGGFCNFTGLNTSNCRKGCTQKKIITGLESELQERINTIKIIAKTGLAKLDSFKTAQVNLESGASIAILKFGIVTNTQRVINYLERIYGFGYRLNPDFTSIPTRDRNYSYFASHFSDHLHVLRQLVKDAQEINTGEL